MQVAQEFESWQFVRSSIFITVCVSTVVNIWLKLIAVFNDLIKLSLEGSIFCTAIFFASFWNFPIGWELSELENHLMSSKSSFTGLFWALSFVFRVVYATAIVVFSVGILLAVVPFDTGNLAGFLYLFYSLSKRETETESLDTPAVEFL